MQPRWGGAGWIRQDGLGWTGPQGQSLREGDEVLHLKPLLQWSEVNAFVLWLLPLAVWIFHACAATRKEKINSHHTCLYLWATPAPFCKHVRLMTLLEPMIVWTPKKKNLTHHIVNTVVSSGTQKQTQKKKLTISKMMQGYAEMWQTCNVRNAGWELKVWKIQK